jgi:hypothetical protein
VSGLFFFPKANAGGEKPRLALKILLATGGETIMMPPSVK